MNLRAISLAPKQHKVSLVILAPIYLVSAVVTTRQAVFAIHSLSLRDFVYLALELACMATIFRDLPRQVRITQAMANREIENRRLRTHIQFASEMSRASRARNAALKEEISVFLARADTLTPSERAAAVAQFEYRYARAMRDGEYCERLGELTDRAFGAYSEADAKVLEIHYSLLAYRIGYRLVSFIGPTAISSGLTGIAILIAGSARTEYGSQWRDQLAGDSAAGFTVSSADRLQYSIGFIRAAVQMRLRDVSRPVWKPMDWLLKVPSRAHAAVASIVGIQAVWIAHHDGLYGLFTDGWGWCGGCAIALQIFFRWLRRVRGIVLADTDRPGNDD